MPEKRVLCPGALRQVPKQFSWVDQRLVRHEVVRRCDCRALALYLVLVCVADAQGLSYYSDKKLTDLLSFTQSELSASRRQLTIVGLIAYEQPLYQVLALEPYPGFFGKADRA